MELRLVVVLLFLLQIKKFTFGAAIDFDSEDAEKALLKAVNESVAEAIAKVSLNASKSFDEERNDLESNNLEDIKNVLNETISDSADSDTIKSASESVVEKNETSMDSNSSTERLLSVDNNASESSTASESVNEKFVKSPEAEKSVNENMVTTTNKSVPEGTVNSSIPEPASESSNVTESVSEKLVKSPDSTTKKMAIAINESVIVATRNSTVRKPVPAANSTITFTKMFDGRTKQKSAESKITAISAADNIVTSINKTPEAFSNITSSETFKDEEEDPLDDLSIPPPINVTLKPPKAVTDNGVILPNKLENESLPEWFTKDRYRPSKLPETDNKVFNEFMRLSKLTQYMLLDPKFAEDYQKGNLTSLTKVLFVVYGDAVKHIFSSPALTYSGPPIRKSRIRFRIKSLNDKPPIKCSEMGRETARLFCPFSYGYRWWDCLMPDEVCDGIPHCGLGDDEDPKMCLYYKAALSQFQRAQHTIEAAQSRQQQIRPPGHKVTEYNPADEI